MQVNLNYSQDTVAKPKFKGSYKRTENGTPYYKTNAGVVTGSIVGGIYLLNSAFNFKRMKMTSLLGLGLGLASIGCGAIIDSIRNKKAANVADDDRKYGKEEVFKTNEQTEAARNGKVYYRSNDGVKHGWQLGSLLGLVFGGLAIPTIKSDLKKSSEKDSKALTNKKPKPEMLTKSAVTKSIGAYAVAFAIGSLILGKITDHFNNKSAQKHA